MAMDMAVALKIAAGVTGQQAVDQLRTSLDRLDGAASQVRRGFDLAKTAVAGFIGLQAVQGIVNMGTVLLDTADRLKDISEQTGYTVEQLSSLEYAAKLSGTSLDAVQGAMGRVAAKAVEAATGNKQAALAFQALGVSVKDTQGSMRSSVDIMADVGDALSEITDNTVRTAVAREIFGKNADALIPFLMNMREAQDEAQRLGATISGEFASKAAQFNDNLDRMAYQLRGIGNTILGELLPGMNALAESMRNTNESGGALQVFANGIRVAFETIVVLGGNVVYVFKEIGHEVAGVGRQLMALAKLDFKEFSRIGDQMWADAKKRRQEIDAWSESIINAGRNAGAGRGFVNPPLVRPDNGANERAAGVLRQLTAANAALSESEKEAARLAKERQQVLQGLGDEINKLVYSEEEYVVSQLRRMNATEGEIVRARLLVQERTRLRNEQQRAKDVERAQEEATRAVVRQEDERRQVLQGLSDQIISMTLGEDELVIARLRNLNATDAEIARAGALLRQRNRLADASKEEADAERKKQEVQAAGRAVFEATRTPAEKLNMELARLNDLLAQGAIDWDTYSRAVFKAQDEFDDVGKKGKDTMSELKQAVEGWGRSATDAFVQFAFSANNSTKSVKDQFKEFVNSVLQDIARMLIYKNITQPLFSAISGMLPFANGGVMTDQGPMPLNRYARGGIANSPQLALFGEGRMPEAYVPLPDGRSIPVTMQGGGGETNVVVNVNMQTGEEQTQSGNQRGTDLGLVIASVVKQELINQRRPGGLLAA